MGKTYGEKNVHNDVNVEEGKKNTNQCLNNFKKKIIAKEYSSQYGQSTHWAT